MKQHIILIGFMGAGKTTVGKLLADALAMPFIDSDEWIMQQEQMSVTGIFETKGEAYFRGCERAFCLQLANVKPAIVSVGGGLPCYEDNIMILNKIGLVIYINTSLLTLTNRLKNDRENRPLLRHMKDDELFRYAEDLIAKRKVFYKMAQLIVPNETNKPNDVVEKIKKELEKYSL